MPPVPEKSATDSPGLPGFRSWRGVYVAVLAVFVLVVAGLTWFSRFFS
jgi:hypothetical protein